ncbi:MAG: trypsin-like peptidase domain-containing protein [Bacteroidetes bacterium]|nr:trypsin-like peptidase domain-containing protein [Bacteroidota bacterium]
MESIEKVYLDELKSLLSDGKAKQVLQKLDDYTKAISTEANNNIIHTFGRYSRLERDYNLGLYDRKEYNLEYNKISGALLYFIDDLSEEQQLKATRSVLKIESDQLSIPPANDFEKIIGREELFDTDWFVKAINASKSVCKVESARGGSGTGFMVNGQYLITNYHVFSTQVISNEALAGKINENRIIFNYKVDGSGNLLPTATFRLDASDFICSPMNEFDYVMVKVKDDNQTLDNWGKLQLDDFYEPVKEDKVNIIQHPEGASMKFALPDSIIHVQDQYVFYLADTKGGSSGSPVFNQDWKVVALHHAGRNKESKKFPGYEIGGEIVEANRGILIKRIIEDIKAKGKHI